MRAYLAGPDVFLHDARAVGARKRELCRKVGIDAYFPLDAEVKANSDDKTIVAKQIYEENIALLERSDIVIANLTPFRGFSADIGTVFEVAYAKANGKEIFGYSSYNNQYAERVGATRNSFSLINDTNRPYIQDVNGLLVENFGLFDNLMLVFAFSPDRLTFIPPKNDTKMNRLVAFEAFQECVESVSVWRESLVGNPSASRG